MTLDMDHILFGIGNPLLDISAAVTPEFLAKYGLDADNQIMAEERHAGIYAELVEKFPVDYVAGGAAQNAIRGAQWMLPAGATVYTGCVGKDAFAATQRETSERAGVRIVYQEDAAMPTGTCAVCVTGTHRSLVANLAACNNFSVAHLSSPAVAPLVEKARFFYIEGFFLTHGVESAMHLARHVAAHPEKLLALNISAPFVAAAFKAQLERVFEYTDLVFGNEAEAAAFAESFGLGTTSLPEIALRMSRLPKATSRPRTVVITHGAEPTIVAVDGVVSTFAVLPIERKELVDSNGAGDAFVAGYLSQLVQAQPLRTCVAAGNYCAHEVLKRVGPTYPSFASAFVPEE